jgi:hypothetical protein
MKMTTPIARMIMLLYLQECTEDKDDDDAHGGDDERGEEGRLAYPNVRRSTLS